MITLTVNGYGEFQVQDNERLVLALERSGVDILHRCGGVARCTTCKVEFSVGEPFQMTQAEHDKLEEKGLSGVRLSCQILCQHDMTLTPVQTEKNSGLEAGKTPAETVEPEPVWIERS
ncbi:(2Fe-2S)-binding protein [Deinococcus psychrotolerans]|uniref:(2Fe-2S)-binding protein n=2 Tax=Deinococcus TaxID=1298 RepID=A0A553UWB9_9DEIO|nr:MULTISPECIES: 2Fe-2S iron-sulfur cluster-binding protein [Deinococcus]AZI41896.1 (2Fe-2S)-binding protein [Deinococcus psychrotolerans]TSA84507.1 (2Fe-2S)-binding protein [Deinococcus detaillensis]